MKKKILSYLFRIPQNGNEVLLKSIFLMGVFDLGDVMILKCKQLMKAYTRRNREQESKKIIPITTDFLTEDIRTKTTSKYFDKYIVMIILEYCLSREELQEKISMENEIDEKEMKASSMNCNDRRNFYWKYAGIMFDQLILPS
jgi:hypothetical protein